MSSTEANKADEPNPAMTSLFLNGHSGRRVGDLRRYASMRTLRVSSKVLIAFVVLTVAGSCGAREVGHDWTLVIGGHSFGLTEFPGQTLVQCGGARFFIDLPFYAVVPLAASMFGGIVLGLPYIFRRRYDRNRA